MNLKFEVFTSDAFEKENARHAEVEELINSFLKKRKVNILYAMMTDTGGYSTRKNFTVGIFYTENES